MKYAEQGFTTIEWLAVMGIIAMFMLGGFTAMSFQSMQARDAALEFRAMIEAARAFAASNAGNATIDGGVSGATVAVTSENGHTVMRLYMGRPMTSSTLLADLHVPPLSTTAEITVVSGSESRPPFAIVVSSSGYATLAAAYDVIAHLPTSESPCPSAGYILRFRAGMHTEDHELSCEEASLKTSILPTSGANH
jgi:hypothetical protein